MFLNTFLSDYVSVYLQRMFKLYISHTIDICFNSLEDDKIDFSMGSFATQCSLHTNVLELQCNLCNYLCLFIVFEHTYKDLKYYKIQ